MIPQLTEPDPLLYPVRFAWAGGRGQLPAVTYSYCLLRATTQYQSFKYFICLRVGDALSFACGTSCQGECIEKWWGI